jgi:hypothetical protein
MALQCVCLLSRNKQWLGCQVEICSIHTQYDIYRNASISAWLSHNRIHRLPVTGHKNVSALLFYFREDKLNFILRFQVLTEASMKFRIVFWDTAVYNNCTSETSVGNYFTRQYIPEDKLNFI